MYSVNLTHANSANVAVIGTETWAEASVLVEAHMKAGKNPSADSMRPGSPLATIWEDGKLLTSYVKLQGRVSARYHN